MIIKSIFSITLVLLLAACESQPKKYPNVNYLSVNLPQGVINTEPNSTTNITTSSRTSIGVYRPPVDFVELLDKNRIYRDVDVVLQTPLCGFPVICMGTDKVITVSESEQL